MVGDNSGEQFLIHQGGGDNNIIIFATEENLWLLAYIQSLYVDGAFEVSLKIFRKPLALIPLFVVSSFITV